LCEEESSQVNERLTHPNPVWDAYFADPFVLRHNGSYYAYGTLPVPGRTIPTLRSTDLVHWEELPDSLQPLVPPVINYWAPEVAYAHGAFWMYYSGGGEDGEGHFLRVARAEDPAGPFVDCGPLAGDAEFSIDAHPFRDDDGTWYLFYCRDFLDGDRPGTGISVVTLADMRTLADEPRAAIRAHADWTLYQADREWYGRRWPGWYTVEGPFVVKRDGRYYCFFSGGAWREPTYGVSYATADHPLGPWEPSPGEAPTVLHTIPDHVLGPGHASIVQGPDGGDWIVYHAWGPERAGRTMRIDRLEWTADGPRCDGPTYS
jgi:beta-xylosidase